MLSLTAHMDPAERAAVLRTAHAHAKTYRVLGRPAPWLVAALEREYQRWRKREQRRAAA